MQDMKIIGSIEAPNMEGGKNVTCIWFGEEDHKAYDHIDGRWIAIAEPSPEIQAMLDRELNTMLVLAVRSEGFPNDVLYLDTVKGIDEQLENTFLGDDSVWRALDEGDLQITITIERMSTAEFAALEPLEL